jgi:phage FluMu protein Com
LFEVQQWTRFMQSIEGFAAEGYTHVEANCPRCRKIRLRPIDQLPRISMGLTLDALARRLRCAECGGPLLSIKPWRQADMLGKPQGHLG